MFFHLFWPSDSLLSIARFHFFRWQPSLFIRWYFQLLFMLVSKILAGFFCIHVSLLQTACVFKRFQLLSLFLSLYISSLIIAYNTCLPLCPSHSSSWPPPCCIFRFFCLLGSDRMLINTFCTSPNSPQAVPTQVLLSPGASFPRCAKWNTFWQLFPHILRYSMSCPRVLPRAPNYNLAPQKPPLFGKIHSGRIHHFPPVWGEWTQYPLSSFNPRSRNFSPPCPLLLAARLDNDFFLLPDIAPSILPLPVLHNVLFLDGFHVCFFLPTHTLLLAHNLSSGNWTFPPPDLP